MERRKDRRDDCKTAALSRLLIAILRPAPLLVLLSFGIARLRLILTVIRPENDFGLGLMSLYYIYYMCTASVPDLHYVFFVV